MPRGFPANRLEEFNRRAEIVRITVEVEAGTLEDLTLLLRHRHPRMSRSAAVREAIGWLLAREAAQIVRGRQIDARRAELAAREAEAIMFSRQERETVDQEHEMQTALAIARGEKSDERSAGPRTTALEAMRARIDALEAGHAA